MNLRLRWLPAVLAGWIAGGCASRPPAGRPDPGTAFLPVASETIYSLRYDRETRGLTVVFRNGEVMEFDDVPPAVASALLASEDPDGMYRDRVEPVFEGRKLEF